MTTKNRVWCWSSSLHSGKLELLCYFLTYYRPLPISATPTSSLWALNVQK